MMGLIALQIRITGDLEKDQQLLVYGIGALIGLIVLSMIVIVVIVLVRRGKASRAAALAVSMAEPPKENTYKPVVVTEPVAEPPVMEPVKEEIPEPVKEKEPEPAPVAKADPSTPVPLVAPEEKQPEKPKEETSQKKYDFGAYKEELAQQNPDDKMDEIRRRLEEIKRQRNAEPAPVLPKVEAKTVAHDIIPASEQEHDPIVPEEEILAEEEMDETRPINEVPDPETIPVTEVPPVERLEPAEQQTESQEETIVPQAASLAEMPAPPVEEEEAIAKPEEPSVANVPATAIKEENESPAPQEPAITTISTAPVAEEEEVEREEIRSEGEVYYTVPNEPMMELQRDPQPEPEKEPILAKTETTAPHSGNGKFLPMKKLTFAEWVELFK